MGFEAAGDEDDGGGDVVPLETPLPLLFRSQTRSFFSAPPVASMEGDGLVGKATARTMWLC